MRNLAPRAARTVRLAALVAAGLVLAPSPAQAQAPNPMGWTPCQQPAGFECATLGVPLDRAGTVPGAVQLTVSRVRAATNPNNTAVLALAGGPGQAAIPLGPAFADGLAPALANRDFLVYDQRGTGLSTPIACRAFSQGGTNVTVANRCANELGNARGFFRTADSVADIEALRVATGYAKLVIYGVSYGTKVALDYAAAFPNNVEALVLDSVVLPEGPDPLRVSSVDTVPRVLSELCRGACASITPSVTRDVRRLASQLRRRDIRGTVFTSSGRTSRVRMGESALFNILLAGDLNPTLRAELPGSMRAALAGDNRPLLRLAVRSAGLETEARDGATPTPPPMLQAQSAADSQALFYATICEEAPFRWTRTAGPAQRARELTAAARSIPPRRLGPFGRNVLLEAGVGPICLGWPTASPAPAAPGPLPNVPTLVINGRGDLRTPLADAQQIRARIPAAQVLDVPFVGHSVLGSDAARCGETAVQTFFAGGAVARCPDPRNAFAPTPRPPTRLGSVRPTGLPGTRGRTLAVALSTITDARSQILGSTLSGVPVPRLGGLRGGRAFVDERGINLRSYQYVPGVRLTGILSPDGAGSFRVTGRGATGTVTVAANGAVSGRLGGRSFSSGATAASSPDDGLPTLREVQRLKLLR